jgi:hypothetical protein
MHRAAVALVVAYAPAEGHTGAAMKSFLRSALLVPVVCIMACGGTGTGTGGPGQGGGNVGGEGAGGAPLSGELVIKNLNVTVDKIDGQVNLTFILENGLSQDLDQCNNGSLVTSSGQSALVDPDEYGECGGFDPTEPDTVAAFCADSAYGSICDYGLYTGDTSSLIAVHGKSDPATSHPWEQVGTEYTLTLEFILVDGEIVQTSATAVVVDD